MTVTKNMLIGSDAFKSFAEQLTTQINKNKAFDETQKQSVEELLALEEEFRALLASKKQGIRRYEEFISIIRNENILSARPYFRERAADFSKYVTPHLKDPNPEELAKYKINILFAKWVKDRWPGKFPADLQEIYAKMEVARERLIVNNMPLAINEAKKFFRSVPLSHMEFTDFIGWCAAGLASGVDKWSEAEWRPLFRSVCMGRMKGNMIESYSQTMLHFYPTDRRILYKANALRFRLKIEDIDKLAIAVNESFAEDEKNGIRAIGIVVNGPELRLLMSAASHVGADTSATDDGSYTVYNSTPDEEDIEEMAIKKDLLDKTRALVLTLPMLERKVIKMKGGLD